MGCVCHGPRLSVPVCHDPQMLVFSPWGMWTPAPVYRGLCATGPWQERDRWGGGANHP
jgi:hypothetical protein